MAEQYGYAGKILRVDLTDKIITEIPSANYLPKYVGGRGLAARIYWDEITPEVGALDPENRLIFATGALTATGAAYAAPSVCVAKAPCIYPVSTIYPSIALGRWGYEIKFAGYDAIIVQGKAEKPVYLWIKDGHVEIRDAASLWGKTTSQTRMKLMQMHGKNVQAACIGPAGENLVIQSIIAVDSNTAFAHGGYGAVMGSKNLKAIAIRGTGSIKVANPERILEVNEHMRKVAMLLPGETRAVGGKTIVGKHRPPVPYFWQYMWPKGTKMGREQELGLVKMSPSGCPGCNTICKTKVRLADNAVHSGSFECGESLLWAGQEQEYYGGRPAGRVLYEFAILTDDLGIDSSLVSSMAWMGFPVDFSPEAPGGGSIMHLDMLREAHKRGILTEENTGLPWSKYGSQEFLREYTYKIAYREGFGDVIAKGPALSTKHIMEHEEFGPRRREMEYLYQKTYTKGGQFGGMRRHAIVWGKGMGDCAVSPMCTLFALQSIKRGKELEVMNNARADSAWLTKWYGTDKIKDTTYWGEDVAKAVIIHDYYHMEGDCASVCSFNSELTLMRGLALEEELTWGSVHGTPEQWSAVFGEDITQEDLMKQYERLVNLERAIWIRDGYLEGAVDAFHDVIYQEKSKAGDALFPREKLENLLSVYYQLRGWKEGAPTRAKLEELGLKDVADELERMDKLPPSSASAG
ncbi:MAG: aldehyde ferredoxin oxidoreductase N-terminal domain-containing protein [Pseudomonadota bacterium]